MIVLLLKVMLEDHLFIERLDNAADDDAADDNTVDDDDDGG